MHSPPYRVWKVHDTVLLHAQMPQLQCSYAVLWDWVLTIWEAVDNLIHFDAS